MRKAILILFLALVFLGCKKQELSITGSLNVVFLNTGSANITRIEPEIYSSDNLENSLFEDIALDDNKQFAINAINYGNYVLKYNEVYGSNVYVKEKGFQINPDKTTILEINF